MNWINKIAFNQGVRGEEPNKQLDNEHAVANNTEGIKDIVGCLYDKNKPVSSDCLVILYTGISLQ